MASPTGTTTKQTTTGTAVASTPEHKSGFPPFNKETFSSQLIWLAIAFGALYVILSRSALPRVGEVIDERRDRIVRDLDAAERLKGETEKALSGYEQALADAKSKAGAIAKDAQGKLAGEIDRERAGVETTVAAKLAEAETRITAMKSKALAQVNDIAADTAGAIVAQLGGGQVTPDEIRRALAPAAGE
jgi:F-type H+-transporting ATPase subunit b